VVKEISPITCSEHCFCIRFNLTKDNKSAFRAEMKSKKDMQEFVKEIKKTKVKVIPHKAWGTLKKDPNKALVSFKLEAKNSLDYNEIYKALPPIQKRIERLKRYYIKSVEAMACTGFGFSLKEFKPVGQFPIPAELPLSPELSKRLGKPKLTAFGIEFEGSPLGLKYALIGFEEEEKELSMLVGSNYQSETIDNIAINAYKHVAEIAKLFVVKKE